jgi:hypothetical protein
MIVFIFLDLLGNAWTNKHFSDNNALEAGRSGKGPLPSPILAREISEHCY